MEQIPVLAEGFAETTNFDIPASGKAFKSLIDNIYSRKIEAPIRELSTNAWDAHREAGIDEPFRMKLPTKFDPLFMVRDYGLGMSHDFIMGTGEFKGGGFKSLFASTKDRENISVGMKGLGSKSPFAYTDSFILRLFTGTSVRTYSTYIGENGIPQLAFQGESPSDERRGTAVQFPVQMDHIDQFYAAAIRVLKGFDVRPEGLPQTVIDGLSGVKATPIEIGSTWKAFPKEWLGEGAWAKQGCVIYPIDLDKVKDGKWLKTLGLCVVIDFPIGSVQMVDSREFLAYDEETIENINNAVVMIHKEIDERIRSIIATAKTPWDIRALYRNDMFSNLGPLARASSFYRSVDALNEYIKKGIAADRYDRKTNRYYFHAAVVRRSEYNARNTGKTFGACYTQRDDAWHNATMDNPAFVFIGNGKMKMRKGMIKRSELLLAQDSKLSSVVLLDKLTLAMHRKLGKAKVLRVDDLPKLPITPRVQGQRPEWERFQQFGHSCHSFPEITEDKLGDINSVYLFINKGSIFLPGQQSALGPQFARRELKAEDSLLRYFKNTRIVFINVRMNEKMTRWPEDKYPRYQRGMLDGVIPSLPKPKIIPMINAINHERFQWSLYDSVLDKLNRDNIRRLLNKRITNPLFELIRFEDRHERLTEAQVKIFSSLSETLKEEIIDRALALGLEVLPECARRTRTNGRHTFPYPLLTGKWEKLAQYLGEPSDSFGSEIILDLITKEF